MFAKIPYIWDYDIDEDKLKNILSGKLLIGHIDKKRAVIRLLEYAPYHEIIRLIGYRGIIARTHKELELTNQAAVDEFFRSEQPEYVFMAAGLTGGIVANKTYPATFLHANISMQDNVFEAAHKHNVKHLIFYGSSCVYPKNSPQPMKEDYLFIGDIEETSEAYAAAKIAGIIACRSYNTRYKTNRFIALVPCSMYGPNDNFDLESSRIRKI